MDMEGCGCLVSDLACSGATCFGAASPYAQTRSETPSFHLSTAVRKPTPLYGCIDPGRGEDAETVQDLSRVAMAPERSMLIRAWATITGCPTSHVSFAASHVVFHTQPRLSFIGCVESTRKRTV
jgi:hypothetical protein